MSFIVGLDLGQKQDYSAVVVLERPLWCPANAMSGQTVDNVQDFNLDFGVEDDWLFLSSIPDPAIAAKARRYLKHGDRTDWPGNVIHVDRWSKDVTYPIIVDDTIKLIAYLQENAGERAVGLIVDATGVGRPVVDMISEQMQAAELYTPFFACTITGGTTTNWESGNYRQEVTVPKRDLVMSAVRMLEEDRLRWPKGRAVGMVEKMENELRNFQMKYSKAGNELFEAERKEHDDLVLALSMATWLSQSGQFPGPSPFDMFAFVEY